VHRRIWCQYGVRQVTIGIFGVMYTDACSCLWQFHWQRLIAKLSEFRALPQRTSLPHAGAKNSFINVLLYIYIFI
jgi:hypothetical protein